MAALGEEIRQQPDASPVLLNDPTYVGVAVTSLPGRPGFHRVRTPQVDHHQVTAVVRATAGLRADPAVLLAEQAPGLRVALGADPWGGGMTEPTVVGELLPGVLAGGGSTGPALGYDRWAEQVAATPAIAPHPVRLRGRVDHADPQTGEVRTLYSHRPGARRHPPQRLRQPAGLSLPVLLRPRTRPTSSTCWQPACGAARAFLTR